MTSFKDVINYLIDHRLKTDVALADFCTTTFGNPLAVVKKYKKRMEITMDRMPIIMVTRPTVSSKQENNAPAYDRRHSVLLYCLFVQPDHDLGFDQLIEFEELIDQAVLSEDRTLNNLVDHIDPGESSNDEGMFHPVYAMVKEYIISREEVY